MNMLQISGSPHIHTQDSSRKIMWTVVIALMPAFLASIYFFGLGALKVTLISVISCLLIEWLIQKFLIKGETTITDGSAVITGLLLAFNVPSNLPWWIIVIGALVAIGIGKMAFGGLGKNIFNPAIVARIFLLISFPVQMTTWPKVSILDFSGVDAVTGPTPLAIVKEGLKNGESLNQIMSNNDFPSNLDMFLGNMGGSLGETSAIALIIGGIILLSRRIISWHIPVSILGTIVIFTEFIHHFFPESCISPEMHTAFPMFHLLSGGVLLGAIFMATDMVTSPMTKKGMLLYGVCIGIITVLIKVWGAYPEGMSFAILIMNGFTPLINKWLKPKRFGEKLTVKQ